METLNTLKKTYTYICYICVFVGVIYINIHNINIYNINIYIYIYIYIYISTMILSTNGIRQRIYMTILFSFITILTIR